MTLSIVDFLNARLDNDLKAAGAAAKSANGNHREWYVIDVDRPSETTGLPRKQKAVVSGPRRDLVADCPHDIMPERSTHIALHDPARVLREVAAKRAILDLHVPHPNDPSTCGFCLLPTDGYDGHEVEWESFPCRHLRNLAAIYSSHPEYRKEWRP